MTTRDPKPTGDVDPEKESARRLHDALTAPFERPFESFGYQARFDYTPSPDSPVFIKGGVWTTIQEEFGLSAVPNQPWTVRLGHDPRREHIVSTSVEIPVDANAGQARLLLQRIAETSEYLLLQKDTTEGKPWPIEKKVDEFEQIVHRKDADSVSISEGYVDQLLVSAGYVAPEIFTNPDDLQEHVATTLGTATTWSRTERITRVIDDSTTVNLERTCMVLPSSQFAEDTEEYTRQSDEEISATIQYHATAARRGELVITFGYADHFVSLPTAHRQHVVPAFDDEVIANHGPDAYQIIGREPIDLGPEAMDELAEELAIVL